MLKKIFNSFLRVFDAKITRYSTSRPLDFSKKNIHPRTLSAICEQRTALVNLEIKHGRTNRFYPLEKISFDPHIFSINQALQNKLIEGSPYDSVLSMIENYKKRINIKNVTELFGLEDFKNKELKVYPPWAAVMPWENIEINQKILDFPKSVKVDRAKNGFFIKSSDPYVIMKEDEINSLPSHVTQFVSLINSIKKNSYTPEKKNSYIEVELLIKEDKFRWKPSGEGNHRATVVASLGYEKITGLVKYIVRYEDAEYWPNVVNGTYQKKEAELIFNRFFEANPPNYNNKWNLFCQEIISNGK